MGKSHLNIAVLTSSRADYGIYLPLLKSLRSGGRHRLSIVAFGTHLSRNHGYTIEQILADGFEVEHRLETTPDSDTALDIALSMAKTQALFAPFWAANGKAFDVILCLGDRYEMFSAVSAAAPFNLRFAHLHGGEISLGAIDNAFRNSITQFASIHFASTDAHAARVGELTHGEGVVVNSGALSLDNLNQMELMDARELKETFGVDIDANTILCTFHPETVHPEKNAGFAHEIVATLKAIEGMNVVITLPNADTMGKTVRNIFTEAFSSDEKVALIENFGTRGYFSAMKNCGLLLGNTSSGILEAASFGKYVIDLGDRQKGRSAGNNVIHCAITQHAMLEAIERVKRLPPWNGGNIYDNGGASEKIISTLEHILC